MKIKIAKRKEKDDDSYLKEKAIFLQEQVSTYRKKQRSKRSKPRWVIGREAAGCLVLTFRLLSLKSE